MSMLARPHCTPVPTRRLNAQALRRGCLACTCPVHWRQRVAAHAFSVAQRFRWLLGVAIGPLLIAGAPFPQADRPLIAVVDSGVARTSELAAVLVGEHDFASVPTRAAFSPAHDHGTLVATVLHRAAGGAVDIVSLRIDDPAGCPNEVNPPCQSDPLTTALAINAAVELDADVINLSLAMPDDPAIVAAVRRASAAGIKVVLAAGNDGAERPGNMKAAIAGYPNAVLVGALDWTGEPWAGSNRPGPAAGTRYSYVWRPGVAVSSVLANGTPARASGTSIAAPIETAFIATGRPVGSVHEAPVAKEAEIAPIDEGPEVAVTTTTATTAVALHEPAGPLLPGRLRNLALAAAISFAFLAGRLASLPRAALDERHEGP